MAQYIENQFFSVEANLLVKGLPLTFEIFIYLPLNNRIIRFKGIGETLTQADAMRFTARGIKEFFIRKDDRERYLIYINQEDGEISPAGPVLSPEEKETLKQQIQTSIATAEAEETDAPLESVDEQAPDSEPETPEFVAGESPEKETHFNSPIKPNDAIAGMLASDENTKRAAIADSKALIKGILDSMPGADPSMKRIVDSPVTEHSTMVAVYSVLFAMGLGKDEETILQDLIVSSFLHDIGYTQIPLSLVAKNETQRAGRERGLFERHVELGLKLLPDLTFKTNPRVERILSEHHEKFNGSGYPAHKESFKIDELAQIVAFADMLDTICRGRWDGTPRGLGDALQVIAAIEKQSTFPQCFNPDLLKRIRKWLADSGGMDHMNVAAQVVEETKQKISKAA
jgi:HD-GYP domain-containing protein (c-di-GMP phosphodiesterase class II)